MKKRFALLIALALVLCCALAAAEINVTKRDLSQARGLDKNVNHILVILQDGEKTNTVMLASVNSRTGRSVMTRVDCAREVAVTMEDGSEKAMPLADVYALGGKKSRGLLVCRELNEMMGLDMSTYVALDIAQLPAIVDTLGAINIGLSEEEASALGLAWDYHDMNGQAVLDYIRLSLPGDEPGRSRCYEVLMQMLYQVMHGGDLGSMVSVGTKMLKGMDTNLNPMTAMTMVSAVQAGDDRREMGVIADPSMTEEDVRAMVRTNIYE